ncbi:polyprenyl synthetase family protein [Candidatus Woesearchaeota archaeon]|nr:polyprenyl synthetase family protein [Candidatus Woesearchaeota archaeon]
MDFHAAIETYRTQINKSLEQFFQQLKKQNKNQDNQKFIEIMQEFTMRKGKRLRPILVIIGYKAFKKDATEKELQQIIQIALTTELLESFFLIHDDIIDNSDLRRGKLTVHKQFEQHYNKSTSQSLALLVGDLVACYAQQPIINANLPSLTKNNLLRKVQQIMQQTTFGQLQDVLLLQKEITQVQEETILNMYQEKTARYTIEGPLQLGAIAANASQQQLNQLSKISLPLGIAFQLRDDILGLFGTVEKIGKPIDSDVKEGKKTILMLKALEHASLKERKYILSNLGNSKLKFNDLIKLRQIVIDTQSLTYSQQLIHKLLSDAKNNINSIDMAENSKQFLIALSNYIGEREQ